jgi:asparagine synthase (glutamine-hydrolysing)
MADAMVHRGPDDDGYYVSGPVGFGFRRLSIIDLATGHQPISNEDGTVWIVFNGEIYNYQELREDLVSRGHRFTTRTDTEVIVHLYEEFGPKCLDRLRGMFGFAIWDQRRRELFLARDRVGIKPIYYAITRNALVFGSEMKAILADPEVEAEVRPEVVGRFLTCHYVPGEDTLLKNIYKLPPSSYLLAKDGAINVRQYWDLQFDPEPQSLGQAQERLTELLEESVRLHMISDVPVGFLLSGGVDSTAMLDFSAAGTDRRLSTFTVGFSSSEVADERPYARLAAERYGTDHHEMTISAKDFADFLPQYAWHMEEPVCEAPAIALYYVSRLAKDFVKVLISGEGGDEAFGGYQTYRGVLWLERLKRMVAPFNGAASSSLAFMGRFTNSHRALKYGPLLGTSFDDYYFSRSSSPGSFFNTRPAGFYTGDFARTVNGEFAIEPFRRCLSNSSNFGLLNRMLYVDTKTSLPDDLLLKADKMTMAASIELRVPLLDHKVLEFAARLPEKFKVRGFTTKYIAKESLKNRIPKEILNRKKVGFPVPFGSWLRTDLRGFVREVLLDRDTLGRGYFEPASVKTLLEDHEATGRHATEILSLVSLELWHRAFVGHTRELAHSGAIRS